MARFLALISGLFYPLFCLARSVRLVFLPNIYLIDIKWFWLLKKIPHEDNCPKYTLIIPAGILNSKRFGADC